MTTYLIDGVTQLPETGDTGWGTTLNAAIAAIDSRFSWVSNTAVITSVAASGITGTTLPGTLVTSSLTSVGTLASLTVSGNATIAGLLTGATTFALVNTTATTVNFAGAATALNIGAGTGTTTVNNALVVTGNLTVNGTTTTVNSTTLTVDDKNIVLADTASPTDVGADGGGITLKGTTDKTLNWVDATDAWTSSEHLNLAAGKAFYISGAGVLSSTTLGSGVTGSSLTSVGTILSGTWNGTVVTGQYGGTGVANTGKTITLGGDLTTSGAFATTITATATTNVTLPTTGTLATTADTHYIGTTAVTLSRASANLALTGISSVTLPGSSSGTAQIVASAAAGTSTVITLPSASGTVVTTGDTGSVTSTMISSGTIVNANINSAAAIASTKISGTAVTQADTGTVTSTMLAGSIADTKLDTIATAGKVSNSATTATNANTASAIVARDASGNFAAGTITAALTGNASTATTLATARTINGVSFDGSANVTIAFASIDDIGDVAVSGAAVGEFLKWNGTSWINATVNYGAIASLSDIGNVLITSAASGDLLKWNGTKWVNDGALLAAKANLASPTFTGTVTLPSGTVASSALAWEVYADVVDLPVASTKHGMIAHVHATGLMYYAHAGSWYPLAKTDSPTFTGVPIAPTAAALTNTTQIATTAFVTSAVSSTTIATLDEIGDVAVTGVSSGQFLKWNGSNWVNDAIDLGTDTTGSYVTSLVAGTGVTLTNNSGEGATPTVAIGQAVATNSNVQFADVAATGTMTVTGETIIGPAVIANKTAAHTLALADQGKIIEMSVGSAVQLTVPPHSSVAFPIGTQINIVQYGVGKVEVLQGAGVDVRGTPGLFLRARYSSATLVKRATNEWYLVGDLSAS